MLERATIAEALFEEKERAQVTLNSIGDAVMSSDVQGNVTYLNIAAESMTGWSRTEAAGHPLEEVFRIVDATTRAVVQNPMALAIRENKTAGLTPNCILIRRDGAEAAIEDSAAPIHDRRGQVTGAVMVFHDVSVTRALSLRMSYLAQHDSLTDLPNRVLLNDRLTQAIALAHRRRQRLAVLFLDVDRFKHVNDSLGHDVGDRLLQSAAQRLLACVRTSDTVSRQGGDEFVILLSEVTHAKDAAITAQKILSALRPPHCIDQHNLHLTVSIGISIYPDDGTDAETLMKHADFAMYHAKDRGRDNCQFFKPDMNCPRTRTAVPRKQSAPRSGAGRIRPALSAKGQSADERDCRRRGPHPLASSAARTRSSGPIRADCGRMRTHRTDRPMGTTRSVSPGARLAECRSVANGHGDQHLSGGVTQQGFCCRCEARSWRKPDFRPAIWSSS